MERKIAGSLMEIGAVTLKASPPFQWASGRLAPIYCDNRLLMSYPEKRNLVADGFVSIMAKNNWTPDVIAGTATAGIPHAAWVADKTNLPMAYVRSSAKGHGKGNQIEGLVKKGQNVVLIEDLISTGGSSLDAAQAIVDAGANLLGVAAIFTYGLPVADERFKKAGISLVTLTNFKVMMDEAHSQGKLTAEDKAIIAEWQNDPGVWSKERGGAA